MKYFLLFILTPLISGCLSINLTSSNEKFEKSAYNDFNNKTANFNKLEEGSINVNYIGDNYGCYKYNFKEQNGNSLLLSIPYNAIRNVSLNYTSENYLNAKPAVLYHYTDQNHPAPEIESDSDYPSKIYVTNLYNGQRYQLDYSSKKGIFTKEIEINTYGMSASDSFILIGRKLGYIITIPLDVATVPFQLILVLGFFGGIPS